MFTWYHDDMMLLNLIIISMSTVDLCVSLLPSTIQQNDELIILFKYSKIIIIYYNQKKQNEASDNLK